MLSPYVTIYQYFDAEETRLVTQIERLQQRILKSDPRFVPESDFEEFYHLRIKLSYCRQIMNQVLIMLKNYDIV